MDKIEMIITLADINEIVQLDNKVFLNHLKLPV